MYWGTFRTERFLRCGSHVVLSIRRERDIFLTVTQLQKLCGCWFRHQMRWIVCDCAKMFASLSKEEPLKPSVKCALRNGTYKYDFKCLWLCLHCQKIFKSSCIHNMSKTVISNKTQNIWGLRVALLNTIHVTENIENEETSSYMVICTWYVAKIRTGWNLGMYLHFKSMLLSEPLVIEARSENEFVLSALYIHFRLCNKMFQ